MAIQRCSREHIYDTDQYSSCPVCASEGYRIDFFSGASGPAPAAASNKRVKIDFMDIKTGPGGGPARPGVTEALNRNSDAPIFSGQDVGKTMAATEGFAPQDAKAFQDINKTVAVGLGGKELVRGSNLLPVTGWLVCIKGPNAGRSFEIHSDYNYLGSEEGDIIIPEDHKISRKNQLRITYDSYEREFFIAPMEGANIIRHRGKALVDGKKLENYDRIDVGDSSFLFMSFCGQSFDWSDVDEGRK